MINKRRLLLIENMDNNTDKFSVNSNSKKGDHCPECGEAWDGGDILEYFMLQRSDPTTKSHSHYKDKTDEEILEAAGSYGWTEDRKVRFGNVIGVQLAYDDPEHRDGISFWQCPGCKIAWSRFKGDRTERFVPKI